MKPYSHEHKQFAFEIFCKKLLRNETADDQKHQNCIQKHEVLFSQVDLEGLVNRISVWDTYYEDYQCFKMMGFEVMIENALLAEALRSLSKDRQEIILLFYIIGWNDQEIADQMNLVRRTVAYRRKRSLKLMKDFMEGKTHE